jgi:hypothetical protein
MMRLIFSLPRYIFLDKVLMCLPRTKGGDALDVCKEEEID